VDKARYLVEAHVLEGRSVSELAAAHGVHRSWIYKLLARYRAGGYEALEPPLQGAALLSTPDSR
jgi:transposase